jgi:TatD DNase family protein
MSQSQSQSSQFWSGLLQCNSLGALINNSKFAHNLGLVQKVEESLKTEALLTQVRIAKKCKNIKWLSKVASDLVELGIYGQTWVCDNVIRVSMPRSGRPGKSAVSRDCVGDARLDTDPTLERVVSVELVLKKGTGVAKRSGGLVLSSQTLSVASVSPAKPVLDLRSMISRTEDPGTVEGESDFGRVTASNEVEGQNLADGNTSTMYSPIRWNRSPESAQLQFLGDSDVWVTEEIGSDDKSEPMGSASASTDAETAVGEMGNYASLTEQISITVTPDGTDQPEQFRQSASYPSEGTRRARKNAKARRNHFRRAQGVFRPTTEEAAGVAPAFHWGSSLGHSVNPDSTSIFPCERVPTQETACAPTGGSGPVLVPKLGASFAFPTPPIQSLFSGWVPSQGQAGASIVGSVPSFDRELEGPSTKKLKVGHKTWKPCLIPDCPALDSNLKLHSLNHHVPEIFGDRAGASVQVARERQKALSWLATTVFGKSATVTQLAILVETSGVLKGVVQETNLVTVKQKMAMAELCRVMGMDIPTDFTVVPLSSPAVLIHWKPLTLVIARITPAERKEFREKFVACSSEVSTKVAVAEAVAQDCGTSVGECAVGDQWCDGTILPKAFDSHFHLDRLRTALGMPVSASIFDVLGRVKPDAAHHVHLVGAVANFCDPATWPTGAQVEELVSQGIRVAVGFHPKKVAAIKHEVLDQFRCLVQRPDIVGFGEIGYDSSNNAQDRPLQMKVLDQLLPFLRIQHVLVIHCRGTTNNPAEAYFSLVHHLRAASVSSNQRIHLNCFGATQEVVGIWLGYFPNTYFGFTTMVRSFNRSQREALLNIDQGRLLLETDAPYFKPHGRKCSAPSLVGMAAEAIAEVRGETVQQVFAYTTENAQRLYSLGRR